MVTGRSGYGFPSLLRGFPVKIDTVFIRPKKASGSRIAYWEMGTETTIAASAKRETHARTKKTHLVCGDTKITKKRQQQQERDVRADKSIVLIREIILPDSNPPSVVSVMPAR